MAIGDQGVIYLDSILWRNKKYLVIMTKLTVSELITSSDKYSKLVSHLINIVSTSF